MICEFKRYPLETHLAYVELVPEASSFSVKKTIPLESKPLVPLKAKKKIRHIYEPCYIRVIAGHADNQLNSGKASAISSLSEIDQPGEIKF